MPLIYVIGLYIDEYVICIKLHPEFRMLLEKQVKKSPTFYSTRWFIAVFSTAGRLCPTRATLTYPLFSLYPFKINFNIIFCSVFLDLPRHRFHSCSPPKLYMHFYSPTCVTHFPLFLKHIQNHLIKFCN